MRLAAVPLLCASVLTDELTAALPGPSHTSTAYAATVSPGAIIVRGHGNGHGRGMSQWGAYGWAKVYAKTWQQILDFYYGGTGNTLASVTTAGQAANRLVSVRLTALDGYQTAVLSDNGTASWSGATGTFKSLLARETSNGVYDVYSSTNASCPSSSGTPQGFTLLASDVQGPITFRTSKSYTGSAVAPADLLGVCEPPEAGKSVGRIRYYRGTIRATNDSSGNNRTVNFVPVESYLRGVVPRESPASWGDAASGAGMNALRAQAVAARSYALSENRYTSSGSYARTCDTQSCQVYGGAALRDPGSSTRVIEDSRTDRAIRDTENMIMRTPDDTVMRTEFSSSNGGRTAGQPIPAKRDDGDLAANPPELNWSRTFSATSLQSKYPAIGVLTSVTTTHDGKGGDFDGYAVDVTITGTAGSVTRTAWQFRGDFDLYSPWFDTIEIAGADITAPTVGPILFVGDSVGRSIKDEFEALIKSAYPDTTYHACGGRGMVGAKCLFPFDDVGFDMDGVSVVNKLPAPAIAIIELGYNDDPTTFEDELDQMISALTTKGVQRIIFVNMSERWTRGYDVSNSALAAAAAANPTISVFNWNAASADASQSRWFDNSGTLKWVHLTRTGQTEFALFLRTRLDALRAGGKLPTTGTKATTLVGLPLARGNKGVMVRTLQSTLNNVLKLRGDAALATDGDFGRLTDSAVRAFQRKKSLKVTGVVDRATWTALGLANKPGASVLSVGTVHPSVKTLQRLLAKVLKKTIYVNGTFGADLRADVKLFQSRTGSYTTGTVGPTTWNKLVAAANAM